MESEENGFVDGQVVWAKLDGYPWWPSRVAKVTEVKPEVISSKKELHDVLIYFFGSHDYSYLRRNKVQSYEVKADTRIKEGILKRKDFKTALLEVEDWLKSEKIFPVYVDTNPFPFSIQNDSPQPVQKIASSNNRKHILSSRESPTYNCVCDVQMINSTPTTYELEWANVDIDEDMIDNIVLICCDKDMHPLVLHHNEKKRKIEEHLERERAKRARAAPDPMPVALVLQQIQQQKLQNPPKPPQRIVDVLQQLQQQKQSALHQSNTQSQQSASVSNGVARPAPVSRKTTFDGEMTNSAVASRASKFSGTLEGGTRAGFLVEFNVEGKLYRGFLLPHPVPSVQHSAHSISTTKPVIQPTQHMASSEPKTVHTSKPSTAGGKASLLTQLGLGSAKMHTDRLVALGVDTVSKILGVEGAPHLLDTLTHTSDNIETSAPITTPPTLYDTPPIPKSLPTGSTPPSSPVFPPSSRRPGRPRRYILSTDGDPAMPLDPIPPTTSLRNIQVDNDRTFLNDTTDSQQLTQQWQSSQTQLAAQVTMEPRQGEQQAQKLGSQHAYEQEQYKQAQAQQGQEQQNPEET